MRLNINLASQPYEDAGNFYRRWAAILGLLVLVTLALIGVAIHEWMGTRSIAVQIASIEKQSRDLDDKKNQAQTILNRPENRGTRERSAFINGLIAIKSFAWSQVFTVMETMMPTRVHIVSIEPRLDKEGQIEVTIQAAGDSREKGIELLQNMERSRFFRNPLLQIENASALQQNQPGGDTMKFKLQAFYIPQLHVSEKEKKGQSNKTADSNNVPADGSRTVAAANRRGGGE